MTHITINDLRASGVGTCPTARAWFEANGVSWRDFKGKGYPIDEARKIGDPRVDLVIAAAEARIARDGR